MSRYYIFVKLLLYNILKELVTFINHLRDNVSEAIFVVDPDLTFEIVSIWIQPERLNSEQIQIPNNTVVRGQEMQDNK
jgi:hypothetical protein